MMHRQATPIARQQWSERPEPDIAALRAGGDMPDSRERSRTGVDRSLLPSPCYVGIDLGTTHSCVAVCDTMGNVHILKDRTELGESATVPSVVAFSPSNPKTFKGHDAVSQMQHNPKNTVYAAKRLIGRIKSDELEKDIEHLQWDLDIIYNEVGVPQFKVQHDCERQFITPQVVSGIILRKMKEVAEVSLGTSIAGAVVTVPAYFSSAQKQATREACKIANLEIKHIINEPTAAVLLYHLEAVKRGQMAPGTRETVLIFDLGGGTFDVTIAILSNHRKRGAAVEVLASGGNTRLGGADFDIALRSKCIEDIYERANIDLLQHPQAMAQLLQTCEEAKMELSFIEQSQISVDLQLSDGGRYTFKYWVTRENFEAWNRPAFQACMTCVQEVLEDAKTKECRATLQIDRVLLVGGSSKIPKIQAMLRTMFPGKVCGDAIDPDEAVAAGAAVNAAGPRLPAHLVISVADVLPTDLGIQVYDDTLDVILQRNTGVPIERVRGYTNVGATNSLTFKVYAGKREDPEAAWGGPVGTFIVALPNAKPGQANVRVKFSISAVDGTLNVSYTDYTGVPQGGVPSPNKTDVQVLSRELKAYQAAVSLPAARDQSAALFCNRSLH